MAYKFGLDEVMTKVNILKEELTFAGDYCPIEHVNSRLKSLDSIVEKARRIDCPPTLEAVRDQIFDVAGIRIVCSFISDAYTVMDMLTRQPDIEVIRVRDYIASPKPNGYKSLNLVIETPVYMSDRVRQSRRGTDQDGRMDFWPAWSTRSLDVRSNGARPVGQETRQGRRRLRTRRPDQPCVRGPGHGPTPCPALRSRRTGRPARCRCRRACGGRRPARCRADTPRP